MGKLFTMSVRFIMVIALSQTLTLTQGQTLDPEMKQKCMDTYMKEIMIHPIASRILQHPSVLCPAVERLTRCMLNGSGELTNQDNVKMVEKIVEKELSHHGITCDLDLSKMASARTDSGLAPGGSGTSDVSNRSLPPCVKDYTEKVTKITSYREICPLIESLLECELKEKPNFRPSESDIRHWEEKFEKMTNRFNMHCHVDVRKALEKLRNGSATYGVLPLEKVVVRVQHGNDGVSLFSATWSLRGMMGSLLSVFVLFVMM